MHNAIMALFRSITVFCGTHNIVHNIPYSQIECGGIFLRMLAVPQNTVMDLNNAIMPRLPHPKMKWKEKLWHWCFFGCGMVIDQHAPCQNGLLNLLISWKNAHVQHAV
jgi:hypothetical protein